MKSSHARPRKLAMEIAGQNTGIGMISQLPETKIVITEQALKFQQERLAEVLTRAQRYWDGLYLPATPEALFQMRKDIVQSWKDASGWIDGKPPTHGKALINTQADIKLSNLKGLYAAEYFLQMHRSAVAEARTFSGEPRELDGARTNLKNRLNSIFAPLVDRTKIKPDYFDQLITMALVNEHATEPPMDRKKNFEACIARIESGYPAMKAADLRKHPYLRKKFDALCDASYHHSETNFTIGLLSAIRSVLVPGIHAPSAVVERDVKKLAEKMVAHTLVLARLGYSEWSVLETMLPSLPASFQKWLELQRAVDEHRATHGHEKAPDVPKPVNARDPQAPFFAETLHCYVQEMSGVKTPSKAELEAMYEARHIATVDPVAADASAIATTDWAKGHEARRKLGVNDTLVVVARTQGIRRE